MKPLEAIEELITPSLHAQDLRLAECKWVHQSGMQILQVAIMRPDGSMDLDTCALVSQQISDLLDAHEELTSSEYYLEVCSPGAERELKTDEDIALSLNKIVFVRFHHPVGKLLETTGILLSYADGKGTLSYRDKALTRTLEFSSDNVSYIRLAVRL
ncbi:MAG: ribosome maturation factor RimP [Erysipelotrichales bacterium]|nr:MAG: ribosome maturation factor RimP [Erysipelotrichales bacterium]